MKKSTMAFWIKHHSLDTGYWLACENAYDHKETLKQLGFGWDANSKSWLKKYNSTAELASMILDIMIACKLPADMLDHCSDRFIDTFNQIEWTDDHLAMWQQIDAQ